MTKEESIKVLTQYIDYDAETPDYYEMEKACKVAIKALEQEPSGDMVSRGVFDQIKWERDIAIEQLHELGYELGQKIEPCEDCISRKAVLEIAKSSKSNWIDNSVLFKRVNELPPVVPKPKTDVLDKIRAEIADIYCSQYCENPYTAATVRKMALEIIDKYTAESEDKE